MAVSKAASVRLRRVLRAGGIAPTPERVQRLADLVQWSVDQIVQRSIPRRPRLPPRRRRPRDPRRAEPIKRRGAPPNRDMRQLVANLAMLWLDETGALPGVTYDDYSETYSGRFVAFLQALAKALADDLPKLRSDPRVANLELEVEGFAADLADVACNPVRVRTWLKAARIPKLKRLVAPGE